MHSLSFPLYFEISCFLTVNYLITRYIMYALTAQYISLKRKPNSILVKSLCSVSIIIALSSGGLFTYILVPLCLITIAMKCDNIDRSLQNILIGAWLLAGGALLAIYSPYTVSFNIWCFEVFLLGLFMYNSLKKQIKFLPKRMQTIYLSLFTLCLAGIIFIHHDFHTFNLKSYMDITYLAMGLSIVTLLCVLHGRKKLYAKGLWVSLICILFIFLLSIYLFLTFSPISPMCYYDSLSYKKDIFHHNLMENE